MMNVVKFILFLFLSVTLNSCAYNNEATIKTESIQQLHQSTGFVLIYNDDLYKQKIVSKKLNNSEVQVLHSMLKKNSNIKIFNPDNLKSLNTKVTYKAKYPEFFDLVITQKIAELLKLDINYPFVEHMELKKNKTFIAKTGNTFEEEKRVAEKVPIKKVKVDNISTGNSKNVKIKKSIIFEITISDFYYKESAVLLKKRLISEVKMDNFYIKKIGNNNYRLISGPFKNINTLKSAYISLNNLGFENLNINKIVK